MAKRTGLKSVIYGIPLAVMIATSGFVAYTLDKQTRLLNDLAVVADMQRNVISNRGIWKQRSTVILRPLG